MIEEEPLVLHWRTPNIAGFGKFSSKNLRILLEVFAFMIGSSGLVFGEETCQPTQRCWVLWVATYHRPSEWSVWAVASLGSSGFLELVRFLGWVNSPTNSKPK